MTTDGSRKERSKEDDDDKDSNNVQYKKDISSKLSRFLSKGFLIKSLGPGIITGAADEDPCGIATYSQAGAQFGFGMAWLVLFLYPMITAVQEMCARIGIVTGSGLAAVIKQKYSNKIVFPLTSTC